MSQSASADDDAVTHDLAVRVQGMRAVAEQYLTHATSLCHGIDKLRRASQNISLFLIARIGPDLYADTEFRARLSVYDGAAELLNEAVAALSQDLLAIADHSDALHRSVVAAVEGVRDDHNRIVAFIDRYTRGTDQDP